MAKFLFLNIKYLGPTTYGIAYPIEQNLFHLNVVQPNEGALASCSQMATHVQSFSLKGQFLL